MGKIQKTHPVAAKNIAVLKARKEEKDNKRKTKKKLRILKKTLAQMKKLDEKIKKNFRDFEHFKRILKFIFFFSFSLNKILFSNQFFYGAYFLLTEKNSNL